MHEHHHHMAMDMAVSFPSVALALFLMGLGGSFLHCGFMCGPFVLTQVGNRLEKKSVQISEWTRLKGALLFPYHLGRMTTYMLLGGFAALIAGEIGAFWVDVSVFLLLAAGILMILSIIRPLWEKIPVFGGNAIGSGLGKFARPLFARPVGLRGYFLGVLLGLLPCGMLYAAISAAASTSSFWQGALAMGVFALGTVPGLLFVGVFGQLAMGRIKQRTGFVTKGVTVMAGVWLCYIAVSAMS